MTKKRINETPEPQVSVTVTLYPQVIEELNKIAFFTENHRTDIIRNAISDFQERESKKEN
jgi:predicted transcriptional regulator